MNISHDGMPSAPIREICILGSTGSIGTQTLDIIRQNSNQFHAFAITAHRNHKLLVEQAREFKPRYVVIAEESLYTDVAEALRGTETEVLCGDYALEEVASMPEVDVVITAMVGYSGLRPTIAAIEARKTIGLANKETLVVGGALIMPLVKRYGARIIPVDSEHSAIYQCLIGEENNPFEKIILTASGGPFRRLSKDELKHVSVEQALKHPNWSMGAKVTIDSASLMNKGFEMMEARWLFDCKPSDIEVLVHPQSIIHSMVQFRDGAVKAQLGMPDMRLPIGYAMGLTERVTNDYPRYNFLSQDLSFEAPDMERFPNLKLAYESIEQGGNMPCILNATNEVAVASFLAKKCSFVGMTDMLRHTMAHCPFESSINLDILEETDSQARAIAEEYLKLHS